MAQSLLGIPYGLWNVERERDDRSKLLQWLTVRPGVFGGKPVIRDLRISVELILSLLAQGVTPDDLLDDYPGLEMAAVHACLAYAHAVITGDTLDPVLMTAP